MEDLEVAAAVFDALVRQPDCDWLYVWLPAESYGAIHLG